MYYLTVYNEPITHIEEPEGLDVEGLLKGIYRLSEGQGDGPKVQLLGSGVSVPWALDAQRILSEEWGVNASVWSVTSYNELYRDAVAAEKDALKDPSATPRVPYVTQALQGAEGPIVATSDYSTSWTNQIRPFVPGTYRVLGTDGYGRSDYRRKLRRFFEVDRYFVALAALAALAQEGTVPAETVAKAIAKYGIDPEKPNPASS